MLLLLRLRLRSRLRVLLLLLLLLLANFPLALGSFTSAGDWHLFVLHTMAFHFYVFETSKNFGKLAAAARIRIAARPPELIQSLTSSPLKFVISSTCTSGQNTENSLTRHMLSGPQRKDHRSNHPEKHTSNSRKGLVHYLFRLCLLCILDCLLARSVCVAGRETHLPMSLRKVSAEKLFVSEPDPRMFGNGRNEPEKAGWNNGNWLKSRFLFSFAEYSDRRNTNFGVLRVLNDDLVQPKRGFGTHGHQNAEIVTYIVDGKSFSFVAVPAWMADGFAFSF